MKAPLFLLALLALPAFAATSIVLPGNSEQATWTGLNNANHTPTSTTMAPWGPIAADASSGSSATFSKLSGSAYFYGSGIYGWHTSESIYQIVDSSPIAGLSTMVLQMRLGQTPLSITLNWNGGSQQLAATDHIATQFGTSGMGDITDHAWQWDLSGIEETINEYSLTFTLPSSTVIYSSDAMTLTTGNTYQQVIPEPSSFLAAMCGFGFTLIRRRRA